MVRLAVKVKQMMLRTGNKQLGFTLLELMVVIVLIGLVSSFVVSQGMSSKAPEEFSTKLRAVLYEITERALVEQSWYGLQVEEKRLRVVSLKATGWNTNKEGGWITAPSHMTLGIEPLANEENTDITLYASPDGLLSPYNLILSSPEEDILIKGPYALKEQL